MSGLTVFAESFSNISGISFQMPETALRKTYRIILTVDEDSRVVARSPDLQGVVTDGKDKNEAVNNAFEAIDSVLESLGLEKEYSLIITHESSV